MTTETPKTLSKGQLAYETERARKAGKSLDEWLKQKARAAAAEAQKAAPKPVKKPGLFTRLLDRAHKPL
ncbi:hypothetical protein [Acidocella sp.]|uniref:hypothetical protein n=1 Tax=Acidocella sp. TaxID=50710 RepID=UPI00260AC124|nr:hypothetical protein [Acidocella sp.]MDD2796269.1 hypothetical protein [Acidocella sp.]